MKDLKFKVHSKEHFEAIQKRLFELGYGGDSIEMQPFIFCYEGAFSAYESDKVDEGFHDWKSECQLATLDDLYNPEFLLDKEDLNRLEETFNAFKEEFEKYYRNELS